MRALTCHWWPPQSTLKAIPFYDPTIHPVFRAANPVEVRHRFRNIRSPGEPNNDGTNDAGAN